MPLLDFTRRREWVITAECGEHTPHHTRDHFEVSVFVTWLPGLVEPLKQPRSEILTPWKMAEPE
ncbi:MAG: hypothetical protein HY735_29875 [Verrucomicrobia bacterium]|nr:hypothetical protein [Verrucomicrobiota bacterium]